MRQALRLICAFALGTAVSAAPAPRPGYYGTDPGAPEYPPSNYYYPTEDPYITPTYVSPYYDPYITPTYVKSYNDPYSTPTYVPVDYSQVTSNYNDPYMTPTYVSSYNDPYVISTYVPGDYPQVSSNYNDPSGYSPVSRYADYPPISTQDPYYESPTPYYQDPKTTGYQYPPYVSPSPDSYNYPMVSSSPAYPSIPTYPTCEIVIEIETYVIEVIIVTEDVYLNEYRYLISTPADTYHPYAFGSIGKSIYKPDAHAAVFYVKSGSLDDDTASLAEFYKAYPHDYPPSDDEALYLWIYEYQVAVVYISRPPPYAAYTEFGVDFQGHLTYAGKSYWAVCPASDCEDTYYVYWIGTGSAPYGCMTDVYLRLVPYGFPSPKSYYQRKGGISGSYPPTSTYAGGYYQTTPVTEPYNLPTYTHPISYPQGSDAYTTSPYYDPYTTSPYYDPYTTSPYYPPMVTPPGSYYPPSSYGYSDPYEISQPTMIYAPSTPTITYPTYTSMVDGSPVTYYQTVTTYDNFDQEIQGRPTLYN